MRVIGFLYDRLCGRAARARLVELRNLGRRGGGFMPRLALMAFVALRPPVAFLAFLARRP